MPGGSWRAQGEKIEAYARVTAERVTTMLHNVLNSGLLNDTAIPFAIARVATGLFFALSGFHKLFNRARHRAFGRPWPGLWLPYATCSAGAHCDLCRRDMHR